MLKIGDFSKLTRVSIRMLRHYDEIDLLKPVEIDPFTGYRYYSEEQLPVAGRMRLLDTAIERLGKGEVYSAVYAWAEANGYETDGPMTNIYHVSPHETQNPDEFVTEVCLPVKKK